VRCLQRLQLLTISEVVALPTSGMTLLLAALAYRAYRRSASALAHVLAAELHQRSEKLVGLRIVAKGLEVGFLGECPGDAVELHLAKLPAQVAR